MCEYLKNENNGNREICGKLQTDAEFQGLSSRKDEQFIDEEIYSDIVILTKCHRMCCLQLPLISTVGIRGKFGQTIKVSKISKYSRITYLLRIM